MPVYLDPAASPSSQLCVEVRLPPLRVKDCACPKLLAAGFSSLFALPGPPGQAMLQWSAVHQQPGVPLGLQRATQEDPDMAPCGVVPLAEGVGERPTAVLLDELSCCMWTGHSNGRVVQWKVAAGRGAQPQQAWRAHGGSKVRALALTPWGDLWTGSSYGSVSVWAASGTPSAGMALTTKVCEVKKPGGGRPHGKVLALACGATGRCVWSVGQTAVMLWDALTGQYLGSLRSSGGDGPYGLDSGTGLMWIDPAQGLDPTSLRRTFKPRATGAGSGAKGGGQGPRQRPGAEGGTGSSEEDGERDDVATAAFAKVAKSVGNVGKFAALLGKRINKTATNVSKNLSERKGANIATRSPARPPSAGGPGQTMGVQPGGVGAEEEAEGEEDGPAAAEAGSGSSSSRGKVKALLSGLDGCMTLVYKSGHVECYSELGRLLWGLDSRLVLHSGLLVGRSLWLGCGDGQIVVLDAGSGGLQHRWVAHLAPVRALALVAGLIYSLASDGAIRGWPAVQPPPPDFVNAWKDGVAETLRMTPLRVLAGTWNVNVTRPQPASIQLWLGPRAEDADIVCVGLQEVEVGTSSVALEAALSMLNKGALEKGNANAQWWADQVLRALGGADAWARCALRQMSGILVMVFCRRVLAPHVGEVATASVACGLMGVAGNKGAAAVSLTLFRRRFVFLSSHFAAHQDKVDERNADYAKIVRSLRFPNTSTMPPALVPHGLATPTGGPPAMPPASPPSEPLPPSSSSTAALGRQQQQKLPGWGGSRRGSDDEGEAASSPAAETGLARPSRTSSMGGGGQGVMAAAAAAAGGPTMAEHGPGLRDADVLIWMGDFNYRVQAQYEWVVDCCSRLAFRQLLPLEQCRQEMERRTIFHALAEGPLTFPPTYKFDKNIAHTITAEGWVALPYDSSEKRRVPAWTDRILWRGSLPWLPSSLSHPKDSAAAALMRLRPGPDSYGCCLDVCDSDHKPVYASLELLLPVPNQELQRKHSMQVLGAMRAAITPASPPSLLLQLPSSQQPHHHLGSADTAHPTLHLTSDRAEAIRLVNTSASLLHLALTGASTAPSNGSVAHHSSSSSSSSSSTQATSAPPHPHRLPLWLDVQPCVAVLPPGGYVDVVLRGPTQETSFSSSAPPASTYSALMLSTGPAHAPAQQLKAELCVVFQHLASLGSGGLARAQQQQGEGQSGQLSLLVRHTAH
ncbi:Endonuclease/exonuclease/phosphatase [Haematococcus lacustris]